MSARRDREKGQAALEFAGVITLLLIVGLSAVQLGLAAYAVQQAGTAARAAARTASYQEADVAPQTAGEAAVSGWLTADIGMTDTGEAVTATATVDVPSVLPLFQFGPAVRSATMPKD
ncbi:pilus assembly protein [Streptomyces sp. NBC_01317]|uniref:TadE/TadG family type IV pilus assembly protein n=1 Tax=Streptomyces sp. NBC_01317 TaxID=2903822 RepID=UPI002E0FA18B|nr:pilus assembly protein [Streptomyces sp. NBC_01317]